MTSAEPATQKRTGQYKKVFRELWRRTRDPACHPTFVIYFFLVMTLVGPMSVWAELFAYLFPATVLPTPGDSAVAAAPSITPLRTALLTFFPAVTATTALQLVWAERKEMRAVAMLCFGVIGVLAFCSTPKHIPDAASVAMGATATALALWLWWVANADNRDLLGDIKPEDSVGGDAGNHALIGNLSGFDV